MLIKLGQDDIVVEDCTEVLEAEPDNSKALFRRAMSLVNLEQWDQAVERQVRVVQSAPGQVRPPLYPRPKRPPRFRFSVANFG